jgi:hypothetical protein
MKKPMTNSPTSLGERPVEAWPVGSVVILLDAWMRNPVEVKIIRHWNADHIGAECGHGLRYYAHVGRIELSISRPAAPRSIDEFDDILGPAPTTRIQDDFADILG